MSVSAFAAAAGASGRRNFAPSPIAEDFEFNVVEEDLYHVTVIATHPTGTVTIDSAVAVNGSISNISGLEFDYTAPDYLGSLGTDTIDVVVIEDSASKTGMATGAVTVESLATLSGNTIFLRFEEEMLEGDGTFTITEPSIYAPDSPYIADLTTLETTGFAVVANPIVTGTTDVDDVVTGYHGLVIHDPQYGTPDIETFWSDSDDVPLAGETNDSHTVTEDDVEDGLKWNVVRTFPAPNDDLTLPLSLEVIEPSGLFTEQGVVFNGTQFWQKTADLGVDNAGIIYFFSGIIDVDTAGYLIGGAFDFDLRYDAAANTIVWKKRAVGGGSVATASSPTVTVGQRWHILAGVAPFDAGNRRFMYSWLAGTSSVWSQDHINTGVTTEQTDNNVVVGARPDSTASARLQGKIYRLAVWTNNNVFDVEEETVRNYLLSADKLGIANPTVANAALGVNPTWDFYGPASGWDNKGTGGTGTLTGTLADA